MVVFTRKFWYQYRHDPRGALDFLEKRGSRIIFPLLKFVIFWRVVFSEYWMNHCITRASALSFTLVLALIPLMASLSFMLASMVEIHPRQVQEIVTLFLPFSPPMVVDHISNFFINAQKVRGIGIVVLVVVAVGLFGTIEESVNTIWKVTATRSFLNQLRTFTMVMVWGPLFFFGSFRFRSSVWLDFMSHHFVVFDILPSLLVVLGFAVLIWLMPNTRVRLRAALIGGLIAGALFELERWGFGSYVRASIQTRTIYGAYGILPFFLISLFVASLFILFGAEIAYVYQNFWPLLRTKRRWDRRTTDYKTYIALRILMDAIRAFSKKRTPPTIQDFMKRYELTEPQALGVLNSLIHEGFLHTVNNREAYVPTSDLSHILIKDIVDKIESENRKILPVPDDFSKQYVAQIMGRLKAWVHPSLEGLTVAKMLLDLDENEKAHKEEQVKEDAKFGRLL